MNKDITLRVYYGACAAAFIYAAGVNALPVALMKVSEDLSFNFTQAGLLGFVSSVEQFFVLILSSFAAARFGKIRTLRTALLILVTGLILFSLSRSFIMALVFILIMGLANGFLEALLTPLVTDLYPEDKGGRMNLLHAFWPVGVFITVLLFGELLSYGVSWRYLFGGLAGTVLIVYFLFPHPRRIVLPPSRADFSHMGEILSLKRFWVLGFALFFSGGAESAFAYWSASFIQVHFGTLPRAGALGAASFALGMAAGRMGAGKLAHKHSLKKIVLVCAVVGLAASPLFFIIRNLPLLYVYLVFMGGAVAPFWPSIQAYGGQVLKVDHTVLMVFLSCFGIPGYSSATLLMGIIADGSSLKRAFIIAPLYILMVVGLLAIEGLTEKRKSL